MWGVSCLGFIGFGVYGVLGLASGLACGLARLLASRSELSSISSKGPCQCMTLPHPPSTPVQHEIQTLNPTWSLLFLDKKSYLLKIKP